MEKNALKTSIPIAHMKIYFHPMLIIFTHLSFSMLKFQEELGIKTFNSMLHLTLKGRGVNPLVSLSVEEGLFDMSAVLVGEFVEKHFKVSLLISSYSLVTYHKLRAILNIIFFCIISSAIPHFFQNLSYIFDFQLKYLIYWKGIMHRLKCVKQCLALEH